MSKEIQQQLTDLLLAKDVSGFNGLRDKHAATRFKFSNSIFKFLFVGEIHLYNCDIQRSHFSDCDFSGAVFCKSELSDSTFERCTFFNTIFGSPEMMSSDLNTEMSSMYCYGANLEGCNFKGSTLFQTNMRECQLAGADFSAVKFMAPVDTSRLNFNEALV